MSLMMTRMMMMIRRRGASAASTIAARVITNTDYLLSRTIATVTTTPSRAVTVVAAAGSGGRCCTLAAASWLSTSSTRTTTPFSAASSSTKRRDYYHSRCCRSIRFFSSSSNSSTVNNNDKYYKRSSFSTAARTTSAASAPPLTTTPVSTTTSSSTNFKEFPSLVISSTNGNNNNHGIRAIGSFAETTASFLNPDPQAVDDLYHALMTTKTGIVAHYYMDVELQSILTAVATKQKQQHDNKSSMIGIADSLRMGDMAVEMVQGGAVQQILCLGVDFMAESVQAILHKNGFGHIPVYRADARRIGCSLAESAEQDSYRAWLQHESSTTTSGSGSGALHVVYINTSLETKAVSSSLVPTITCTSSNVLQTLLQASIQLSSGAGDDNDDHVKILYGPDTYMGHNLQRLLEVVAQSWSDNDIRTRLHSQHSRATLQKLRHHLHVFPSGNCIVHHMFGKSVVDTVQQIYLNNNDNNDECFVTAHLEVPGEMFEIAMTLSLVDKGVAGSTSDILKFIQRKVQEYATELKTMTNNNNNNKTKRRLRFILGTEAGMVTSIVQSVQEILNATLDKNGNDNDKLQVEIIFPVAQDAVMATNNNNNTNNDSSSYTGDANASSLPLVPGVSGGEGCSTAGGCATCPFMKMNDLDAVMNVLDLIQQQQQTNDSSSSSSSSKSSSSIILRKHLPPDRLRGRSINGQDAMDLGTQPILYMQQFMKDKKLPNELCQKVWAIGKMN